MIAMMDRNSGSHCREVARLAEERLKNSPYTSLRNVTCRYHRGTLVLLGRVPTFYHKQLAQETVARLDGVAEVVNKTEVVSAPS